MNKYTKHTPGPWIVYTKVNPRRKTADVLVRDRDQNDIAQVFGETRGEAETDARLISAAPDLLAALETIATGNTDPDRAVEIAREAIAKVGGAE